jgi:acyl carrier protein
VQTAENPPGRDALTGAGGRSEEEVRSLIRGIVAELAPNPGAAPSGDADLVDDLEYHSVALVELAFTLEDEFDLLPIDEATARTIRTVGDIENHVVAELRAREAARAG